MSGLERITDSSRKSCHVGYGPIVLKKSAVALDEIR
jgi:hypothetical protein